MLIRPRFARRNRIIYGSLLVALFAALTAGLTSGCNAQDTPATLRVLPNGLRLIVKHKGTLPLVALDIWVKAGSGKELANQSGAAHFLEHLIFKGTPTRKPGEIDAAIEDLGATLNAGTTQNGAHFYTTVAKDYIDSAVIVVADVLRNSSIDPKQTEIERAVILDELARSRNDEYKQLRAALNASLFSGTPYAHPVLGDVESIKHVNNESIVDFYHKWYLPNNVTVVIVGDITVEHAESLVKAQFGTWIQKPIVDPEAKSVANTGMNTVPTPQTTYPYALGYGLDVAEGVKLTSAGQILALTLGDPQWGRLAGKLTSAMSQVSEVPVPKRAIGIRPNDSPIRVRPIHVEFETVGAGCAIYFSTRVNQAGQTIFNGVVETELSRLQRELVSSLELTSAIRMLKGRYLFDTETYGGLARFLGEQDSLGDYRSAESYFELLDSLKATDLRDLAQRLFEPARQASAFLPKPSVER